VSNSKLTFTHEIPIEMYAECDLSLEILINETTVYKTQCSANTVHRQVINFEHEYIDSKKNKLTFLFSGDAEVEKKHLKILQICLNKQFLNRYNAEYFPDLNPEWWQDLSEEEKIKQKEIIYGNTGAVFGWYGKINFYYCVGFDQRSRFYYNRDTNDHTRLMGEKINWIFLDENSTKAHNKIK
jgi:hypothetical protein